MKTLIVTKDGGDTDLCGVSSAFSRLRNGVYDVTIKRHGEKRTINQNSLMWLWLTCIERETGTPKDDIYLYYCARVLSRPMVINGKTTWVHGTTSSLTKDEMQRFLDFIQADAATEFGITLPDPSDRYFEDFYNTYK